MNIASLYIYPIKSCRGIEVREVAVTPFGFKHDREFVIVDENGAFLSQRRFPQMARIKTQIKENILTIDAPHGQGMHVLSMDRNDGNRRTVDVWGGIGTGIDMGDSVGRYLSRSLGIPCRLLKCDLANPRTRHSDALKQHISLQFQDGYTVNILSHGSFADLNGKMLSPLEIACFRPNIVMTGCEPYAEDAWNEFEARSVRLKGVKLCVRCIIPTINPARGTANPQTLIRATGKQGIEPLATLATYRRLSPIPGEKAVGVVFGKNFIVTSLGILRQYDEVMVS